MGSRPPVNLVSSNALHELWKWAPSEVTHANTYTQLNNTSCGGICQDDELVFLIYLKAIILVHVSFCF